MNKSDEALAKLKAKLLAEMKDLAAWDGYEEAHIRADSVLCELLVELGHRDIVEEFDKVGKWYA